MNIGLVIAAGRMTPTAGPGRIVGVVKDRTGTTAIKNIAKHFMMMIRRGRSVNDENLQVVKV